MKFENSNPQMQFLWALVINSLFNYFLESIEDSQSKTNPSILISWLSIVPPFG